MILKILKNLSEFDGISRNGKLLRILNVTFDSNENMLDFVLEQENGCRL